MFKSKISFKTAHILHIYLPVWLKSQKHPHVSVHHRFCCSLCFVSELVIKHMDFQIWIRPVIIHESDPGLTDVIENIYVGLWKVKAESLCLGSKVFLFASSHYEADRSAVPVSAPRFTPLLTHFLVSLFSRLVMWTQVSWLPSKSSNWNQVSYLSSLFVFAFLLHKSTSAFLSVALSAFVRPSCRRRLSCCPLGCWSPQVKVINYFQICTAVQLDSWMNW